MNPRFGARYAGALLALSAASLTLALPGTAFASGAPGEGAPAGGEAAAAPGGAANEAGGDGSSDPVAHARRLYGQGVDAMNAKDWPKAEQLFEQAWALEQHFTIAGNLGTCELEQSKFAEAAGHLAWAVEAMRAEGGHDAQRVALERQLVKARARAAALELRVRPAGVMGVTVRIDGREVGWPGSQTIYLPVGEHEIEVRAPDGRHAGATMHGEAGVTRQLVLDLGSEQTVAAPSSSGPPMWPAYVGAGVGVGLLAAAMVAGLSGGSHEDDADALRDQLHAGQASCSAGCPELLDEYAAADTAYDYRTGFLVAGISTLALSVAWGSWALASGGDDEPSAARVQLVPTGAGLAARGWF